MKSFPLFPFLLVAALIILCVSQADAQLPIGIKAVWDVEKAYREKTKTRERVCLNGLWRWQPAKDVADVAPNGKWGYFKVPGSWPGITNYMQNDSQTVHAHPSWKDKSRSSINTAWYQREITIPGGEERLFKVIYKEDSGMTGKPRNLKYKMRVAARRLLSELRDECMFYKGVLDG